eukprot:NODE_8259_length_392_cov_208.127596.p2 GENE.NODE_8259_length_392_cov_208.127596~~NODE_8259_length_392_cov_208.127596.p2  ORF type:complete len:76 (-),score=19.75 NODE_8259_length_392_cov_208.127596:147-374(-)
MGASHESELADTSAPQHAWEEQASLEAAAAGAGEASASPEDVPASPEGMPADACSGSAATEAAAALALGVDRVVS